MALANIYTNFVSKDMITRLRKTSNACDDEADM
jgi:hypothetical protein